jgi:hypothetical protein
VQLQLSNQHGRDSNQTHSGSIFSIILRLLSFVLSACLKNLTKSSALAHKQGQRAAGTLLSDLGASSISHLGSMVMHSCMYLRADVTRKPSGAKQNAVHS